jgi:hypothetical protein
MARAKRLHIDLARPHRVVHALIEEFDEAVKAEGWDTARVERLRRELRGMTQRVLSEHGAGDLLSIRGNSLMTVVPCADPVEVRKLVRALRPEIQRMVPGVNVVWGISAAHDDPLDYKTANSEAHIALRAGRRMGGDQLGVYDQLGVVRLLLASDEDADLSEFVDEIIGPLIEHDRTRDAVLTTTLRAYFDSDCSQQVAAKRLYVHHKTLRYRLDRIEALTSLDLRRHEDPASGPTSRSRSTRSWRCATPAHRAKSPGPFCPYVPGRSRGICCDDDRDVSRGEENSMRPIRHVIAAGLLITALGAAPAGALTRHSTDGTEDLCPATKPLTDSQYKQQASLVRSYLGCRVSDDPGPSDPGKR